MIVFVYLGHRIQSIPTHINHQVISVIHQVNNTTKQGRDELRIVHLSLLAEGMQEGDCSLEKTNEIYLDSNSLVN